MNISVIRKITGYVLILEGALLLLPSITALYYGESEGKAYLEVAVICALLGLILSAKKAKSKVFYIKEGCVATALSWVVLSVFGAFPFMLTGEIPSFFDAFFETVSGFTTTGASILTDVEAMSHCSLFWRSFTHWIGGMGILVFLLAVVPVTGGSDINLMKAESPGPSVGKIVPKIRKTAFLLYIIYFVMTIIQIVFLLAGGMNMFECLLTTFGTAGTGGFGFKSDSFASYSPYIQWVVTIFMVLFGVNFNAYYLMIYRQFKKAFSMEEVRWYIIIILASTGIIFTNTINVYHNVSDALRHSAFQVASIITTTGYTTDNYDLWSSSSRTVLVMLMFIGACAGSTGGGIKVSRIIIGVKNIFKEMKRYTHPKSVNSFKIDGKTIEPDVLKATNVYFVVYIMLFGISVLLVSFDNSDLITTFTAVATTFNNVGPAMGKAGPNGNFFFFSDFAKVVMSVDMLLGRLEIFPLLMLFNPSLWSESIKSASSRRKKKKLAKSQIKAK